MAINAGVVAALAQVSEVLTELNPNSEQRVRLRFAMQDLERAISGEMPPKDRRELEEELEEVRRDLSDMEDERDEARNDFEGVEKELKELKQQLTQGATV